MSAAAILDRACSEREFQAAVVQTARLLGWRVCWTWKSIHSPEGEADLRLVRPPRYVVMELKREDGQPTYEQYAYLEEASRCPGIEAFLFRPSDWNELEGVLR